MLAMGQHLDDLTERQVASLLQCCIVILSITKLQGVLPISYLFVCLFVCATFFLSPTFHVTFSAIQPPGIHVERKKGSLLLMNGR